jgi:hypothetical protein
LNSAAKPRKRCAGTRLNSEIAVQAINRCLVFSCLRDATGQQTLQFPKLQRRALHPPLFAWVRCVKLLKNSLQLFPRSRRTANLRVTDFLSKVLLSARRHLLGATVRYGALISGAPFSAKNRASFPACRTTKRVPLRRETVSLVSDAAVAYYQSDMVVSGCEIYGLGRTRLEFLLSAGMRLSEIFRKSKACKRAIIASAIPESQYETSGRKRTNIIRGLSNDNVFAVALGPITKLNQMETKSTKYEQECERS